MLRTITTAAAALAASLALQPPLAQAAPNESGSSDQLVSVTEHVAFRDLDLTNPGDARVMLRRIQAAAARACAQPRTPLFPTVGTTMDRCAARSVGEAVARLDSPLVLAAYGRSPYQPVLAAAGP